MSFSFESFHDESIESRSVDISRIKFNPFNRDLTTEHEKKSLKEFSKQLENDNWVLMQKIAIQKITDPEYDFLLIVGERRTRAFLLGNQQKIEADIYDEGHFSDLQIRKFNLVENTQRQDEPLISIATRYKQFLTDFDLEPKDAAVTLGVDLAKFSKMVNHIVDVPKFQSILNVVEGGRDDLIMVSQLVLIAKQSESAVNTIINFCIANNCLSRSFIGKVKKINYLDELNIESSLMALKANKLNDTSSSGLESSSTSTSPILDSILAEGRAAANTDSEQTVSEQTDSEQTDSEQTDSEQTDSEQTDSEQTDSEQTDSEQTELEQTELEKTELEKIEEVQTQELGGFKLGSKKKPEICLRYKDECYILQINQVVVSEHESEHLVAKKIASNEIVVLPSSECTIEYVV